MIYLTNVKCEFPVMIKFIKKTQKTRLSRIIKELNDLCTTIYKINNRSVNNWIIVSQLDFFKEIKCVIEVDYVTLYYSIKILRAKILKLQELTETTQKNLANTNKILSILDTANCNGFLHNYQAIRRKYVNRKINQQKKIERNNNIYSFACSINFFYFWLVKILILHPVNKCKSNEICDELDVLIIDEYIRFNNPDLY